MIPTVGFNMRKITKGNVVIKLWDLGGQARFRSMWERYCRGVNVIVFVLDSADHAKFPAAKAELFSLLEKTQLSGIPLLVLGNKNDLAGSLSLEQMVEQLYIFIFFMNILIYFRDLTSISNREVAYYSISAKNSVNIDMTLNWLIKHAVSTKSNSVNTNE